MDLFDKYYNLAVWYLARRSHSEKEIRDKLKKKKIPEESIEAVIKKLYEQKYLDDDAFATWWVEQRSKFRPKSQKVIKLELKAKGVSADILASLFNKDTHENTDLSLAKALVTKRIVRFRELPKQQIYQKLGAFLARRGFDWQTIKESIDDVLSTEYNES